MLTMWRRFPYKDPNLPADYLPADWHGPAVRRTFQAVHQLAAPLAAAHAHEVIAGAMDPVTMPLPDGNDVRNDIDCLVLG